MEWSEVDIFKLINLYHQFPCLWEFRNPLYKRVDKKKQAWEEIAKNMGKSKETIRKKIKNLRSAYLVEKKKVESSKKSGFSAEDAYIPHLYYYNEMKFLDLAICLKQTTSSLPVEDPDILEFSLVTDTSQDAELYDHDNQLSFNESYTPLSTQKVSYNSKKRKSDRDQKINIALDAIISKTNENCEEETMFSCFGKSVGLQLKKMPLNTAVEKMADIQKLLSEAINKSIL